MCYCVVWRFNGTCWIEYLPQQFNGGHIINCAVNRCAGLLLTLCMCHNGKTSTHHINRQNEKHTHTYWSICMEWQRIERKFHGAQLQTIRTGITCTKRNKYVSLAIGKFIKTYDIRVFAGFFHTDCDYSAAKEEEEEEVNGFATWLFEAERNVYNWPLSQ